MRRLIKAIWIVAVCCAIVPAQVKKSNAEEQRILAAREAVWRAWFANDEMTLRELVPADVLVISSGERDWKTQAEVFRQAKEFHDGGGTLLRLAFPRSIVQRFGDCAIVYSSYELELKEQGKQSVTHGRATEVFVRRHGRWVNVGWHTDSE